MDNINRVSRPQAADVVGRPQGQRAASAANPAKKPGRVKKVGLIVAIIAAVALIIAGAWFLKAQAGLGGAIDDSRYQAVFFTNGQVYFGKLSVKNGEYMSLKNVYYLQTKFSSDSSKTSPQSASKQDASDVELIKLGNEIHGPEDQMIVAKDQILFFENLKPQGTVSKTILKYQKK